MQMENKQNAAYCFLLSFLGDVAKKAEDRRPRERKAEQRSATGRSGSMGGCGRTHGRKERPFMLGDESLQFPVVASGGPHLLSSAIFRRARGVDQRRRGNCPTEKGERAEGTGAGGAMRETYTGAIVALAWPPLSARSSASAFRSFRPLVSARVDSGHSVDSRIDWTAFTNFTSLHCCQLTRRPARLRERVSE